MAQAISEFTKDPTNGLNSFSIFIQDNFEHAGERELHNHTDTYALSFYNLKSNSKSILILI